MKHIVCAGAALAFWATAAGFASAQVTPGQERRDDRRAVPGQVPVQ
jgi:hypothetical protein